MRRIKGGIVINKIPKKICHNPNCKNGIIKSSSIFYCTNCNYLEYCSLICKQNHWEKEHKFSCKKASEINLIESLILESRCDQISKFGLHQHPKIKNDKINFARTQLNDYVLKLATQNTILSCNCNCKIGNKKNKNISTTVMLEYIACLDLSMVHVFVRCDNLNCIQRKNAQPLFDLCPLSNAYRVLIIIPNQKEKPDEIQVLINDSKNISNLPEDYDQLTVEVNLIKNCSNCIKTHVRFRLTSTKTKKEGQNDNNNLKYMFNDIKDVWEII